MSRFSENPLWQPIYAKLLAFFDGKVMVLQSRLSVPKDRLIHIALHTDGLLIEPGQIALAVTVAMIGGSACPIDCFFKVFLYAQTFIIEIAHLALCKGIALLGKGQMPFEAFIILLCVKIFFNQLMADVELSARLVVRFWHCLSS